MKKTRSKRFKPEPQKEEAVFVKPQKKFFFPSKGGRKACVIEASNREEAHQKYNQ
jgi:hypothetical protein